MGVCLNSSFMVPLQNPKLDSEIRWTFIIGLMWVFSLISSSKSSCHWEFQDYKISNDHTDWLDIFLLMKKLIFYQWEQVVRLWIPSQSNRTDEVKGWRMRARAGCQPLCRNQLEPATLAFSHTWACRNVTALEVYAIFSKNRATYTSGRPSPKWVR